MNDLFDRSLLKVCVLSCFFLGFLMVYEDGGLAKAVFTGFVAMLLGLAIAMYIQGKKGEIE